jgi:hypothetical protein
MSRRPNFSVSQWFRQLDRPWTQRAACLEHQHLPWTDDRQPPASAVARMREICAECPVLIECARYALTGNNGHGADGGMYAGVWIPWSTRNGRMQDKELRRRGRCVLRALIR